MKKYLLLLLLTLTFIVLVAVESDPSATVGYFKKSIASNAWDTMSLPFNYAHMSPDSIFGTQFSEGDVIQDVGTGDNWTFYTGYGWFPSSETYTELALGAAYWIYRFTDNPPLDYFIMGTVDPQPVTTLVRANGWSCFSLNESIEVSPDSLVIIGVLEGDVIQDVGTGDNWTYYDGYGWFPSSEVNVMLVPTHSYWFYTTSPTDFTFTYPLVRNGRGSTVNLPTNVIHKMSDFKAKK